MSELASSLTAAIRGRLIADVRCAARPLAGSELVIITGAGGDGSAPVTSGVEKVFFTGSPENGRRVMSAASQTLTPVALELGGKIR